MPPKPEPKPRSKPTPQPQKIEQPSVIESQSEPVPEEAPLPLKQDFVVPPQPSKPKLPDKSRNRNGRRRQNRLPNRRAKNGAEESGKEKNAAGQRLEKPDGFRQRAGKSLSAADSEAMIQKGTETANTGIEGGSGGSYFSELSISETDAIAARLRQCWNLDPGAMGIEDMIVEIRAYLNRDGTVQKVDILDSSRYNRDVYFRSVADSARRAVYICQPYGVLPQKYGDKYDVWKTMLLRFDPINHTVR